MRAAASADPAGQEKRPVRGSDWACPGMHSRRAITLAVGGRGPAEGGTTEAGTRTQEQL